MPNRTRWDKYFTPKIGNEDAGILYNVIAESYQTNDVSTDLFKRLYQAATAEVGHLRGESLVVELQILYDEHLLLQLKTDGVAVDYLRGDFLVFIYFMQLHCNPSTAKIQPIALDAVWGSDVDAAKRYDAIMLCLLGHAKKSIMSYYS